MKWLWRILKYLFVGLLLLVVVVFILLALNADYEHKIQLDKSQLPTPQIKYKPTKDSTLFKELLAKYGNSKVLPKGYEIQALIALSFYPELKETPIEFVQEETYIPLSSRPSPLRLLTPWRKRKYLVVISTKSVKAFEPILLKNLPYNGQIGVFGHELAHTVDYLNKSGLKIAQVAWNYATSESYRQSFERATDLRTIQHGLGYQLKCMSYYITNKIEEDKALKKEVGINQGNYYSPHEIDQQISRMFRLDVDKQ